MPKSFPLFFVPQFINRSRFLSRLAVCSFLYCWFYLHSHDIHHKKLPIKRFHELRDLLLSYEAVKLYINAERKEGESFKWFEIYVCLQHVHTEHIAAIAHPELHSGTPLSFKC